MNGQSSFPKRARWMFGFLLLALSPWVTCVRAADLQYPLSIAMHEPGSIFLADRNLPGIWRLEGDQLNPLFQGVKKFRTPLNAVRCVAVDRDGKLLAGDSAMRDIYRFDDSGQPQPLTAQGKDFGQIGIPMDIVADAEGNLLVSDLEIHRIVKVPKGGGDAQEVATITAPRGLFYDDQSQLWVIANRKLVRISPDAEQETVVDDGVFQYPHTVVVGPAGVAYVCDGYAKTIWKIEPGKEPAKWASGEPFVNPVGMEIHGDTIFVADPHAKGVFEIDKDGKVSRREAQPTE